MSLLYDPVSFPRTGAHAISGFVPPSNSGIVPVTELRNLLDDTWARNAVNRASSVSSASRMPGSASCLSSNGLFNTDGSGFGFGNGYGFNLSGLGSVLGSTSGSIAGIIGDLQMAVSMQSLVAGLARSIGATASAIFGLLDRALSAVGPAADFLMSMASGLMGLAGKAVDLFAGAFQLAGRGLLALGDFSPGEVFSGIAGKLEGMLGGVGNAALQLFGNAASLAANLASAGIDALLAPTASIGKLLELFSPITGALSSIGSGVGAALSQLNLDTLSKVAAKIGESLAGAVSGLLDGIAGAASTLLSGALATIERFQGVSLIDGQWQNGFRLSQLTSLGLSSLLSMFGGKSTRKFNNGASSNSAIGILLATVLGNSAPVSGSFLVTDSGWLGSANGASNSISASLAEACAFNAAMMSALRGFMGAKTSDKDGLMSSLECRRGTYNSMYGKASLAQSETNELLRRLLALWYSINGGSYPNLCPSSPFGLGRCA